MKKYLVLLFMIFMAAPAAATENPFFLCFDNQAGFQFGQSTGPGNFWNIIPGHEWKIEPFQIFLAQYSQPAE
ncbi:MAG: hypothetical protein LBG89_03145, partial [Rickettsiales bacterium]|nr:hypothetical protein [Rickettsiales bacterium]